MKSYQNRTIGWLIKTACIIVILCNLCACSKRYQDLPVFVGIPFQDAENHSVGRFKTSYMADQIHAYFRGNLAAPIAVTTFVDIDNLYQSSTFGRILAEQLISELSMRGYQVIEIRLSDAVQIMEGEGELGLSREMSNLKQEQEIAGLVVGTYAHSDERVYLNARLINPSSARIISVGSVEMAKTDEIGKLLRGNSLPTSLERIPVRHLAYTKPHLPYEMLPAPVTAYQGPLSSGDSFENAEAPKGRLPQAAGPKARMRSDWNLNTSDFYGEEEYR